MYLLNNRRKWFNRRRPEGAAIPMSECVITVETPVQYTGVALFPRVTVMFGDDVLVRDVDYALTYKDNVNLGNGTVTVTGIGAFTGHVVKTFTVNDVGGGGGSWVFDVSKTELQGVRDMSSVSSDFRSMNMCPVKSDDADVIICSHEYAYWMSMLTWDGESIGSISRVKVNQSSGFEYGGTTHDGFRFVMPYYGQSGAVYVKDLDDAFDIAAISKDGSDVYYGVGPTIWATPFYGFSSDGAVLYRTFYYGSSKVVYTFRLAVPYDVGSRIAGADANTPIPDTRFRFSPDGMNAVAVVNESPARMLVKYSMTSPFDFSTASEDGRFDLGSLNPSLFCINDNGTRMIAVESSKPDFHMYNLTR